MIRPLSYVLKHTGTLATQFITILKLDMIFPGMIATSGTGPSGSGLLLEGAGTNYLLAENGNYLIQE